MKRTLCAAAAAGALALSLTACGGGGSSPTTFAGPTSASPTGASCDADALNTLALDAVKAQGQTPVDTRSYECEGGWAVVLVNVQAGSTDDGFVPVVFEDEGGQWVEQELDGVCADSSSSIPAELKTFACDELRS